MGAKAKHRSVRVIDFTDAAATKIYALALHGALPMSKLRITEVPKFRTTEVPKLRIAEVPKLRIRAEPHMSELQSRSLRVSRRLLDKKN